MTNRKNLRRAMIGTALTAASAVTLGAGGLTFPDTPKQSGVIIAIGVVFLVAAIYVTNFERDPEAQ